jgi:hypothetical protein
MLSYRICILDSENICSLLLNDPKIYNIFLRIYINKQETSKLNSQETAQNIEKLIFYISCQIPFFYPYSYEALSHLLKNINISVPYCSIKDCQLFTQRDILSPQSTFAKYLKEK